MNRPVTTLVALLISLGVAGFGAVAVAKKPPGPHPGTSSISIVAKPNSITFGGATTVSGALTGAGNAGVTLTLQQSPYPFKAFAKVATAVTSSTGGYTFAALRPTVNTKYRVTGPKGLNSSDALVFVRKRVTLGVSDSTPAGGQRVRFSGKIYPPHVGMVVYIQRLTSRGYRTVARTLSTRSTSTRSAFSVKVRVNSSGRYRARVAADADHAVGTSLTRRLTVH